MAERTFKFLVSLYLLLEILIKFVQSEPTGHHPFKSILNLVEIQKGQSVSELHLVKQYLKKFGYLNQVNDDEFDDLLESAIRTYQQKFRLEVTGRLDKRTVNQMMKPRCGVPDIFNSTNRYNSSKTSDGAAKADYSKYKLDHGDDEPFDGPGGIFAHGFRPTIGMLHFDADETWSSSPGTLELDLESVAVHEIGHLLGLGHSGDHPDAIMYPYFDYGMKKRNLQEDDIEGIRDLYGL
ncbi:hypothetical protein OIU76_013010 [Salix suchowensis]|nr:hypothetical protein OIU76_013010 [Salix suchowensis]